MPRANHTGRPERGALLPALRPHPRTCRPAPPLPALPAPPRQPPHPARPVLSRPRPLLLPRPRFLLSPPPRRTSGSRIPPKLLFSARGPRASWKSRGSPEAHPREGTLGGWGRGATGSSGGSRGVRVRSTSEWLPCPSAGHRRWGTFFRATRHLDRSNSLRNTRVTGALGLLYRSLAASSRPVGGRGRGDSEGEF